MTRSICGRCSKWSRAERDFLRQQVVQGTEQMQRLLTHMKEPGEDILSRLAALESVRKDKVSTAPLLVLAVGMVNRPGF